MKCTKAIIVVGGYGSRFLPMTKAIEKCMLPLGNRPVIDYVVQDCIKGGIRDFYFVISEGATQIKDFYGPAKPAFKQFLKDQGKDAMLPLLEPPKDCNFTFIEQPAGGKYGTAVPVWLCRELAVEGEKVLVIMGDQIFYNADGTSETAEFLAAADQAGAPSAMLAVEVPHEEVYKYGIVATKKTDAAELFDYIIEKPAVDEAPTNLNNASFYLFDAAFFTFNDDYVATERSEEYYLTDPLNSYVQAGYQLAVIRSRGVYLDCGSPDSWLTANIRIAGKS